jgi:hypothetical protein
VTLANIFGVFHFLCRLVQLLAGLNLDGHQNLGPRFHAVQQLTKEFKRFAFVLLSCFWA